MIHESEIIQAVSELNSEIRKYLGPDAPAVFNAVIGDASNCVTFAGKVLWSSNEDPARAPGESLTSFLRDAAVTVAVRISKVNDLWTAADWHVVEAPPEEADQSAEAAISVEAAVEVARRRARESIIAKLAYWQGGHNASEVHWGRLGMCVNVEDDEAVTEYFYKEIAREARAPLEDELVKLKARVYDLQIAAEKTAKQLAIAQGLKTSK